MLSILKTYQVVHEQKQCIVELFRFMLVSSSSQTYILGDNNHRY